MDNLRVYYFTTDGYNTHYTVMAESAGQAVEFVKHFLFAKWQAEEGTQFSSYLKEDYEAWKDATVDKLPDNGRDPWYIEEYEIGQVLETERS